MGILRRFRDIMSANVNSILDKAEDPAKMVDQYMRDLEQDLGKVKAETATVMAEETRARRELLENSEEIEKMDRYARKALMAGNEADAKLFLEKKAEYVNKKGVLEQALAQAEGNARAMRQMHDKLCADLDKLRTRKESIKAKMTLAKTQERMNQMGSSFQGAADSMSAFDRMEEKANQMLDKANAMAELNREEEAGSLEDLMGKYDSGEGNTSDAADEELAALKKEMGL